MHRMVFFEPEPFETPALEFVRLEEQRGEKERLACVHAAHEHLMKPVRPDELVAVVDRYVNPLHC